MDKEQNEFKLVRILNKYFPDILLETLSECANEIIQAGYYPIQADDEGLLTQDERAKYGVHTHNLKAIEALRTAPIILNISGLLKAQKALDDDRWFKQCQDIIQGCENKVKILEQKQAKAVKKVFDLLNNVFYFACYGDYSNGVEAYGMDEGRVRAGECLKEFEKEITKIKQTLEEL